MGFEPSINSRRSSNAKFSWRSPGLKQRMFSSQYHFLRNLAKFPWAGSYKHGSEKWAGRERKKESDTSQGKWIWQKRYCTGRPDRSQVTPLDPPTLCNSLEQKFVTVWT